MRAFTYSLLTLMLAATANAQTPDDPAIEACRTTGLLALKERSPALKDLSFDMESLAVSKANTLMRIFRFAELSWAKHILNGSRRPGRNASFA